MPTYHVTTVAELKAAFDAYASVAEPTIIEIDADIDYNDSQYYRYDGDFLTIGDNTQAFTVNGNGHTLSNIYLYPNRAFIKCSTRAGCNVTFNNIKIECITNNSYIFQSTTNPFIHFNSCIFNAKVYAAVNPLLYTRTEIRGSEQDNYSFINCVFNLYLSGINVDQSGSTTDNDGSTTINDRYFWNIILNQHSNYNYPFNGSYIISGCMFNIRNATTKFIEMIRPWNDSSKRDYGSVRVVFDNNAIFYSDVGLEQPPYVSDVNGTTNITVMRQHKVLPGFISSSSSFQNNYIAQFDQYMNLNPDFVKPVFEIFSGSYSQNESGVSSRISTSFYDKDKIDAFQIYNFYYAYLKYYGTQLRNLNGTLAALTTEQCKDPVMLGAVGYIFAQEI